jgi:elongation factor Tu
LQPEEGGARTPFFANYRPQFYYRTDIPVSGTVEGLAADIFPGQAGLIEVELDGFTALTAGRHFVVRDGGLTVGAGIVVEVSELETP